MKHVSANFHSIYILNFCALHDVARIKDKRVVTFNSDLQKDSYPFHPPIKARGGDINQGSSKARNNMPLCALLCL